ncbi:hypothetical protein BEWA_020070 [Theileria equi strain WA]|uniref:Uncharacterized protein n=1 Tax=Theileria equi strain WA TaxID=1537102 RepID=L0AVV5_THEEQ|nr:hypothetical protein BEWA_020070 [Theileria equi strain WA]AFZ79161.1 hypothetical protein BEWA_020070 [Theileria equi strain WA]|eukprot:XP_004828827.1 hypothetical protein BEWA_020070 [Theileria equi strain WA]
MGFMIQQCSCAGKHLQVSDTHSLVDMCSWNQVVISTRFI